ncbi:amino acid adenylation domain-containing protein [Brasilonema sp. CT11]|nr:amino acid adenylation domain-containing protein [Brasilonema sp. CT11]
MLKEIDGFRLSPQQKHVWQLQLINSLPYRAQCSVLIEGNLDIKTLKAALEQVVNRHEILHTIYNHLPGMTIPLQIITDSNIFWNEDRDISSCTPEEQQNLLKVLFYQANQESFNLQQGPLLKLSVIKQSPSQYILLINLPAISADNVTLRNLVQEISRSYAACSQGKKLDDDPLQYADLAEWQNNLLEGSDTEAGRDYWRKQDVSALSTIQLPFENQPARLLEFQPQSYKFQISADLAPRIQALAQQYNASVSDVFLASWQILLWRLTGQKTLAVGILLDGRKYEELETAIGLFAKYLPIFLHLKEKSKLSEIIHLIHESKNNIYKWQEYFSWEQLVGFAQNSPESSFFPLCFEEQELGKYHIDDNISFSIYEQYTCIDRFKVKLCYTRQNDSLVAELHYDSNIFQAEDIQRLAGQFQTLLASLIEHPETAINQLEILSQIERQQLLTEFNNTKLDYPLDKCIHQLFEEQAVKTPDKIALIFEDQQLTYREINTRANQLGSYLQQMGVGPEVLVGLCLERSHQMVIGLLGILKAGGAYVPLDPTYPKERLAFMLQDVQVPVLLTQESLVGDLPEQKAQVVCLDKDWPFIYQMDEENLVSGVTVANLAYVIYTSGSTGKPKGVRITHANLCHYVQAMRISLGITAEDVYLHTASIAFSSSVRQLMVSLTQGTPVTIATSEQRKDPLVLFEGIKRHDVTIMDIVPSFWRNCIYTLAHLEPESRRNLLNNKLRLILTTGEALLSDIPTKWTFEFKHNARPINMFGQTETSGTVAVYPVSTSQEDRVKVVPLGRPIPNTQIYLLDRHFIPVPMGVPGELYIGGFSLGQGYFNRPDLTAQNFIPNPFSSQSGSRLYKTGDLGRYLPDGNIEFLGRIDYLVNLRGFRIEPAEIEAVLSQHPSVREAVVLARKDETGEQYLAAYVVPSQVLPYTSMSGVNSSVLQSFLREKLPEYMIPSTYTVLEALPLTPTGKVNRPALPASEQARRPELDEAFVAPRTPVEQVLAEIWARFLGTEYVGIHDNFFSLGGHSLLATQVVSQIRETFQVELRLRSLFETPTVAGLAEVIETAVRAGQTLELPPIERVSRKGELPLSFAQERLWFLDHLEFNNALYNLSRGVILKGSLNVTALEQSLNEIVRRHEVLRTSFTDIDGSPVQKIASALSITLSVVDLRELPLEEQEAETRLLASLQARQSFKLTQDSLLRLTLLRLKEEEHILLFTIHHIVADGWSAGIIVKEVAALYEAFSRGKPSPLTELSIQYADFAVWQRQWMQAEVLKTQLSYWKEQLDNLPMLQLPTDRPRPAVQTFRGAKQSLALPTVLTRNLKALSQQQGVTLFMTLLTAFQILLHSYTGQDNIVVGTDVANRNRIEIEGLIGFFVNQLVLRTNLSENPTFRELLARVRRVTLDAYTHQDLPFNKIVESLNPERNLSREPLFQVKFVLQNEPVPPLALSGLTLKLLEIETTTATLDLFLRIVDTEQELAMSLEYNTDLFRATTVSRFLEDFETILQAVVTQPEYRLIDLKENLQKANKQKQEIKKRRRQEVYKHKLNTVQRQTYITARKTIEE